jgi:nucleoside phosphorylase
MRNGSRARGVGDAPAHATAGMQTHVDVVIITALRDERDAVVEHLVDHRRHTVEDTIYDVGAFQGQYTVWNVAVCEVGPGNANAAVHVERARQAFSPSYILFVGVAGGLKEVDRGDVVAAPEVCNYEFAREGLDDVEPRPQTFQSAYRLVQRARAVAASGEWRRFIKQASQVRTPGAHVKVIAAGEKVIAHRQAEIAKYITKYCSRAVAVEMEGYGFLNAAHIGDTKSVVIRGISDLLDDKNPDNDRLWQPVAARHAAGFAFAMLHDLEHSRTPTSPEQRQEGRSRTGNRGLRRWRRPAPWLALAAAIVLLAGGVWFVAIHNRGGGSSTTPTGRIGLPSGSAKRFDVYQHYDAKGLVGDIGDIGKDEDVSQRRVRFIYNAAGMEPHEWDLKYINGKPNPNPARFAGIMFLSGWGTEPGGYDLRGRTRVAWQARSVGGPVSVEFIAGGVMWVWNEEVGQKVGVPYPDSMRRITLAEVELNDTWQAFSADLPVPVEELRAVVAPFGWVVKWDANGVSALSPRTLVLEIREIFYERTEA